MARKHRPGIAGGARLRGQFAIQLRAHAAAKIAPLRLRERSVDLVLQEAEIVAQ